MHGRTPGGVLMNGRTPGGAILTFQDGTWYSKTAPPGVHLDIGGAILT
jgi:hypothetical protein